MKSRFNIAFLSISLVLASACMKEHDYSAHPTEKEILFSVSQTAMQSSVTTKAVEVNSLSSVNVTAASGSEGSESALFVNKVFTYDGTWFKSDAVWPSSNPGPMRFYASNKEMGFDAAGGSYIDATAAQDILFGYIPSPSFGATNALPMQHLFGRVNTVTVESVEGFEISDISVSVSPRTTGRYYIRTDSWSNVGTLAATQIFSSTSTGTQANDLWLIPGEYLLTISWVATKDYASKNYTDVPLKVSITRGRKNNITLRLGGNGIEANHLTFEAITDGTITWTKGSYATAKTIQYRKNGGEWTDLTSSASGASINVVAGDKVEFIGNNSTYAGSDYYSYANYFGGTAQVYVYGDVTSLLNYTTTLTDRFCLSYLFYRYANLKSHSSKKLILGATTLSRSCYRGMFQDCSSLTVAPELPSLNLNERCYANMFQGCTSLTHAPELPATSLSAYCYNEMFYDCSSLTEAPELPATNLNPYCYYSMFSSCTSLSTAPELPATTLQQGCYAMMFASCKGLTSPPVLPAENLAFECYTSMFYGCSSLTEAPELLATSIKGSCYSGMFSGCTSLTSAPELPATTLASSCYSGMFFGCTSLTSAPELPATTLASSCYSGMFKGCTGITSTPELPVTKLAANCYSSMFSGCTSLTSAPELPATTLTSNCYDNMFADCISLTSAPELPATTLASGCYANMFKGCIAITSPVNLPATTIESYCYDSMFSGCTSLTHAPELPAPTLASYCYRGMFTGCTSLTSAPELPAPTLVSCCYQEMFAGCTSLNYIKCLATDISASYCTRDWVEQVKNTGTFIKAASMASWRTNNVDGIPNGWTLQDASSEP